MRALRSAFRLVRRAPAFTAGVLAILILGVGAGNALFAVVDAALFQPLPYARADRLVQVDLRHRGDDRVLPASYPEYRAWLAAAPLVRELAGWTPTNRTATGLGSSLRLPVTQVTANFFQTLGVPLYRGRGFRADEERAGTDNVVVLTYSFWRLYYGGRDDALGRSLELDGVSHIIVGVLPPSFAFDLDQPAVFMPLGLNALDETSSESHWLHVVGRLADGATVSQAQADLARALPATDWSASPTGASWQVRATPLRDAVVGDLHVVWLILLAAALCLALTAAASLANLTATRAVVRRREFAVRRALGASRADVLGLFGEELGVLGIVGGVGALLIGQWTARLIVSVLPATFVSQMPYLARVRVDGAVLAVSVAMTAAALLPSLAIVLAGVSREAVHEAIKAGSRGARAGAKLPLGGALVAVQVALAVGTGRERHARGAEPFQDSEGRFRIPDAPARGAQRVGTVRPLPHARTAHRLLRGAVAATCRGAGDHRCRRGRRDAADEG